MPHRHDPDCVAIDSIKEAMPIDEDLAISVAWRFRNRMPDFREAGELAKSLLDLGPEAGGSARIPLPDVVTGCYELGTGFGVESDSHAWMEAAGWRPYGSGKTVTFR